MPDQIYIGNVSKVVGLKPRTIRYYEQIELIPPTQRKDATWPSRGYRVYTDTDINRLKFIKQARILDLTLHQIKTLLEIESQDCCCSARDSLREMLESKLVEIDERIADLKALQTTLSRLSEQIGRIKTDGSETQSCSSTGTISERVLVNLSLPVSNLKMKGGEKKC